MKPTVLQLIDSFHQGGSERQALQLTRLLHESGRFRVRLASLSSEGVLRDQIADLALGEVPSFPLTNFYDRNALAQMKRLVRWINTEKIDLIHTHDFYTNVFGMVAGKLAGVSVRVASMRETAGMRSAAQRRVQRFVYSLAHQVTANSNAVRSQLIKQGVRADKISVIYNGLDLNRLASGSELARSDALSLLGLPADDGDHPRRFITIVANMHHDVKDHPMFLRMARSVHEIVPEAAFLLAGEGDLVDSLKALAADLGLEQRTFFMGRCARIAELLSVSEVCVLTSKAEGFSNSILEYMAAARPVVATAVGGAPEVIVEGESGYLVPAADDKQMAERIVFLLNNAPQARVMGESGARLIRQKFSSQAQLESTETLYQNLLRSKRRNGGQVQSEEPGAAATQGGNVRPERVS